MADDVRMTSKLHQITKRKVNVRKNNICKIDNLKRKEKILSSIFTLCTIYDVLLVIFYIYLPYARLLVGRGSPAGVTVSHITKMLAGPSLRARNGSRKIRCGRKITSESSPGA